MGIFGEDMIQISDLMLLFLVEKFLVAPIKKRFRGVGLMYWVCYVVGAVGG